MVDQVLNPIEHAVFMRVEQPLVYVGRFGSQQIRRRIANQNALLDATIKLIESHKYGRGMWFVLRHVISGHNGAEVIVQSV
jgi:uncharacterized protein YdiU (UPF0061 family)